MPSRLDVLKQYKDWKAGVVKAEDMKYPVYKANGPEGTLYILPMVGTGLWGPVWGYLSVKSDGRTVFGSTFDHKGETPGLGAEIVDAGVRGAVQGQDHYRERWDLHGYQGVQRRITDDRSRTVWMGSAAVPSRATG